MSQPTSFDSRFMTTPSEGGPHLIGTKCLACGVTTFGSNFSCEHCASREVEEIPLNTRGVVWSYTVLRYPSPPPYRPPDPYVPVIAAWVELPEGVRVIGPLVDISPENVAIGLEVEFVSRPGWQDNDNNDVLAYAFRPAGGKVVHE